MREHYQKFQKSFPEILGMCNLFAALTVCKNCKIMATTTMMLHVHGEYAGAPVRCEVLGWDPEMCAFGARFWSPESEGWQVLVRLEPEGGLHLQREHVVNLGLRSTALGSLECGDGCPKARVTFRVGLVGPSISVRVDSSCD